MSICIAASHALQGQTVSGVFYGPGGSVAVGTFLVSTSDCSNHYSPPLLGEPNYNIDLALYDYCAAEYNMLNHSPFGLFFLPQQEPISKAGPRGRVARAASAATSSSTLTLSSSVPILPFLGNWLVGLSYVSNDPSDPANATAAYKGVLRRQSDCSLDQDFILPGGTQPDTFYINSLTGAQDYYHQLAGLTTKADVFAKGCDDQVLGRTASHGIQLLGTTSSGAIISAELAGSGLYVTLTDLTANTFRSTPLTSDSNAGYFYAASLRKNGVMDLVETGLTDPVTKARATAVLLGNGDGTFKTAVYYDVADTMGGPGGFTVDDVNGDGIPDIVVMQTSNITYGAYPMYTGTVTTLIGKGDGTFTTGPVSNVSWASSNLSLTGDFNGDGKQDLMVGATVLLGAGDGSFTVGSTNAAIAVDNVTAIFGSAVGDLRNSGKLDVVVSSPGMISIFYGNGDGTFQTGPRYAAIPNFGDLAITDIDGDGNPDIVLGGNTGGTYTNDSYDIQIPMFQILMGRGDGTFVDSPVYSQGTYGRDKDIASADFNGDGKTDVLVYNNSGTGAGTLAMLPGNGAGALGTAVTSSINIEPSMLVAWKMNHDTLADAVVVGSSNASAELAVLINQGNGTFAGEKDYALAGSAVSLAVGDFNGDGLADVAVGESGQGVYVLFGQSNGTLGTPVQVDTSANPTGLAAGSLTTDGRADLIVGDQATGAVHVYLGNANGTFTTAAAPTISTTHLNLIVLGDLNNDGKLDLTVAGFTPGSSGNPNVANIYTFLGNGDGTFKAAGTLPLISVEGSGTTSMAVADFNKDGNQDIVIGNAADYTEVLFGKGDGTLIEAAPALGQRPVCLTAADLNGDGYPELLIGQANTDGQGSTLAVLLNQGTWTASTSTITPTVSVSASPSSITTTQSTTVTITVNGGSGNPTPTGSVILNNGTYTSAATALSSGAASITVPGTSLTVGTNTLTAAYTPDTASSTVYNSAAGTGTLTVTSSTAPNFSLSNSGGISFQAGATTGNTATATVSPSNGFTGAVSLTCAVTTAPAGATSPVTCGVQSPVTITGTTAQNSTLTVTSTTTTTAGAYAVTVTGTSGAITATTVVNITVSAYVAPASFALTNGGGITISSPGATTGNTSTITVTPSGGFTGSVTLTAALATSPAGAIDPPTFSFGTTSPVNITGAAATGTLTISTTPATSGALARPARPNRHGVLWTETGGATLACVLLFGIGMRGRRKILGLLVLLVFLVGSVSSCGGGGGSKGNGGNTNGNTGTTTGSYTITVTGTSGSISQTTTVSLTVN